MQKDRHNIYSREELLKLIKEGKNAPADMDEFELEAMEGLKLLDKPAILNELDKEVDEIIIAEKKKENQRNTIYYFSAAASLLLLIGLIFLFKNEVVVKEEKVAAAEKPKEENTQLDLAPPVQAEAPTTYEAKEPEQAKLSKQKNSVLAENKTKQKQSESELRQDNTATDISIEQAPSMSAKNSAGNLTQEVDRERKEQAVAANQTYGTAPVELKADKLSEQQAQDKSIEVNKSKKVAASMTQPAMAYQSKDESRMVSASPGTPDADVIKAEEKTKPDVFYANSAVKSKASNNYKEASFISGDSAFAAYVKQNLNVSSPNNSGIIVAEFLVNKDGTASNIKIIKSLAGCEICSKDVIDLIRSIKKWQPAIENGKAITAPKKVSIPYN